MSKKNLMLLFFSAVILGIFIARIRFPNLSHLSSKSDQQTTQSAINSAAQAKDAVLATVGEESITAEDVEWESALHTTLPNIEFEEAKGIAGAKTDVTSASKPLATEDKVQVSDALIQRLLVTMIERKLLYHWVKEFSEGFDHDNPSRYLSCLSEIKELTTASPGFFTKPKAKERLKSRLCEKSLIDQYLHEKIYPSARANDSEIAEYYKTHTSEFKEPVRIVFRQILLPTEKAATDLRAKVNRNNFEELARTHSIAAEASQGGRVGPFSREQLPTFFDIAFNMQIGEISGILRSDYGFHIVMPIDRLPATNLTLGEARAKISKKIEDQKRQELYQNWLNTAMNAVPVRSFGIEENK